MKELNLSKTGYRGPKGPVVLVVMDGVGIGKHEEGDAVKAAYTPNMEFLAKNGISTVLQAHGTAVGLPSDEDMGNSEVGHNAIGCGRVFAQGAKLVKNAINSGAMFKDETWQKIINNALTNNSTLHFIGLFSDGNVHSHIDQLNGMIKQAQNEGVKKLRVHILLDGRDVGETSALEYVLPFESFLKEFRDAGFDYRIASGGGRMKITMDRYGANWNMVKLGWETHVKGIGPKFESASEAIETLRNKNPGVIDQDLPPFVIAENGEPIGKIVDNDSVVFFNFRGDRGIEISRAFEEDDLTEFDRGPKPDVCFAGMMQYDGDLNIPKNYLVAPPAIDRTLGEYLVKSGVKQLAVSETQKFGHVTYFFNGNRSGKFDKNLETYVEIPSDRTPFEERPWMKCAEITDRVCDDIINGDYRFIRLNFPNGDMVGHTGVYPATVIGVASVDMCLGRIIKAVQKADGILVVSSDHGNADDMYEHKKDGSVSINENTGMPKAKTSHSLNPVPAYVYDPGQCANARLSEREGLGISSLAATCIKLLGFEPPEDYDPSIVDLG
ncbi:MAG: 2,3-bisphosphoglycerate-independent phosphoglycerate mutase [Lentisphaerae bacterium]|nr:2,3-bisphosphoglycerate-independent phosphoglycerate mutase [Lentisphaerota bacterium]